MELKGQSPESRHGAPDKMGRSFQQGPTLLEIAPGGPGPANYKDTVVNSSHASASRVRTRTLRCAGIITVPTGKSGNRGTGRLTSPKVTQPGSSRPEFELRSVSRASSLLPYYILMGEKRVLGAAQDYVGNPDCRCPSSTHSHENETQAAFPNLAHSRADFGKQRLMVWWANGSPFS